MSHCLSKSLAAMNNDLERPETPTHPSSPPDNSFNESSDDSSTPSTPKRAPSPPRWRFVNEAKSIYGYNSLAAGKVVKGKTADELGAKYVPPNITLYTPSQEEEEVGKLEIFEKEEEEEELPTGYFEGLPTLDDVMGAEPKKYREWDNRYHVPPKLLKDYKWYDGQIDDLYRSCNESIASDDRGVGQFEIHQFQRPKNDLTGDYKRNRNNGDNSDDDWQLALDSSWQLSEHASENELNLRPDVFVMNDTSSTTSSDDNRILAPGVFITDEDKYRDKKRCRYYMLFLLLFFLVLLGVVLGTRTREEPVTQAAAVIAIAFPSNSTEVPSAMPSNSPSGMPSAMPSEGPTTACPAGMKEFALDFSVSSTLQDVYNATWELIDACTGEVVSKCLPCSLGKLAGGKNKMKKNSGRDLHMEILEPMAQCIPSGTLYNFHIYSTDDPDSCCGFDVTSFTLRYGNEIHSVRDDVLASAGGIDYVIYPGLDDAPCTHEKPSASPSEWPTLTVSDVPSESPTETPTYVPTIAPSSTPTEAPTRNPVTKSPTKNPIVFVGGCPETFQPLSYYSIGSQVETNSIVYECINYRCGSYGYEPGQEDNLFWQQGWMVIGACDGTLEPTERPTDMPTPRPTPYPSRHPTPYPTPYPTPFWTPWPTGAATTCTTKSDFNLCLALDNSGSVCNHGVGECLLCEPSIFCQNLFSFIPKKTCCRNYIDMIEFSKLMVLALDQFEGQKSFSVVQFSTSGQVISNLASADETIRVLDDATYQGGSTDHADAIRQCQNSLSMTDPNTQNFIMLITDGLPSTTYPDPEVVAAKEAAYAHAAGTHIIPIFISASHNYDSYAQDFMYELSSHGEVFDVTGFESLDSLKDSLIQQVSCS